MSVLKLSKKDIVKNDNQDEKITLKKSDISFDTARASSWEASNKQALGILTDYNNRINNSEWLDEEDRKAYRSALDTYINTASRLREANNLLGDGYSEDDEKKWMDYVASMNKGYDDISGHYSQFKNETEYSKWYQDYSKKKEYENTLSAQDFGEYSQKGASAANPDWEKAHAPFEIFGLTPFGDGEDIKNMVTFAEANKAKAGTSSAQALRSGSASKYGEIVDLINSYMTDEEKGIYNYYVGKGDAEKANEYLDYITNVLKQRQGGKIADQNNNKASEAIVSAVAGLDSFRSGIGNIDNYILGKESDPASALQYAHADMSSDNEGVWKVSNDLLYTTGNMAPSILVSLLPGIGPALGKVSFGASAVGNAYSEMKNRGYNEWQARGYATLVGASEVALQSLLGGVGKLGGKYSLSAGITKLVDYFDHALARLAIEIPLKMGSEALEEGIQTVLEPAFHWMVTGEKFEAPEWEEVFYSALLGALSAGVLEGAPAGINAVSSMKTAADYKNIYGENAHDLVAESLDINPDNAHAKRMQAKLDSGKELSGHNIAHLVESNDQALVSQDKAKIKSAVEARLTELGETGDISKLADVIVKAQTEGNLKRSERDLLTNSKYGRRVSTELNPDIAGSGEYTSDWTGNIGTERVGDDIYNRNISKTEQVKTKSAVGVSSESVGVSEKTVGETNAAEAKSSLPGKAVATAVMKDSENNDVSVKIAKISNVENGEADLELESGETVKASDVDFGGSGVGIVYQAATEMVSGVGGFNIDAANLMVRGFDPSGTMEQAAAYVAGFNKAYRSGALGYPVSALSTSEGLSNIPAKQRELAYNLGKAYGVGKVDAKQANIDRANEKSKGADTKKGKLYFDGSSVGKALSETQRASLKGLKVVAEAMGMDIQIFESPLVNGKRVGENGSYDPKTKTMRIDLHAGADGSGLMLFTASHELTHHIREVSPAKFKVFADALLEEYTKNGVSLDALIESKIEHLERNGRIRSSMTEEQIYDLAYEEVVADSCEAMLVDSNAIEALSRKLQEKDKGLWDTIKDFIAKLVERIKNAYKGLNPDSAEANYVRDMVDSAEKLQKLWVDALLDAADDSSSFIEVDTATGSVAPMFSERTWTESEYVVHRDQMAKKISEALGVSVKKAKSYIDDINSIAKMIANDRARLDYEASSFGSAFVSNVEYGGSFDYTTLCKKRRIYTGTFTEIQKRLNDIALTPDDILTIRNMMIEEGIEATCGLCYVEGSRANMGKFAKEFIKLYKRDNPLAWIPNMADVNTPDGVEQMRISHPEAYDQYVYFWNHYGKLKDSDPALFASQQKPKLYEARKEYKGEILEHFSNDASVEKKNRNGGIRMQSFSDFEIVHLIDTMQVIMDMSTVGLAGQAYTKVPEFAKAFGNTGLKINLSLIAKGVDENGNLIFDDREGMPHETAFDIRDKYSKNVGTILVIFTDEQLHAAMADPRIDYIIPFHRSQWKKGQYGAMGLPKGTKDYTYMQNEKLIKKTYHEYRGRMVLDKASNYMPNEYWDFSKSGKENAEAYLKMCAENNKRPKFYKLLDYNGKGTYSLKADGSTDGYWKLLIDFKMYDNDGVGSPQKAVTPTFNMDEAKTMLDEYKGGHSKYPVASSVVDKFVENYNKDHDTKYSDRDTSYMEAVKRGDMDTAQKMVDEVAKETGYKKLFYHGTSNGDFTTFNTHGKPIWITEDKAYAETYAKEKDPNHYKEDEKVMPLYAKMENTLDVTSVYTSQFAFDDYKHHEPSDELKNLANVVGEDASTLVRIGKKNNVHYMYELINTKDFADLVKTKGYDSIKENEYGNITYGVFGSSQLKSADVVTYSKKKSFPFSNGKNNIIPLSERFNTENNDIRYSDRAVQPITEAEYESLKTHFGVTNSFKVAGYLLPDGKMLDFSGKHWGDTTSRSRQVDHRDVQEVLERGNNGISDMVDMIGSGSIRLMPETGGINLSVYPNEKQRRVLSSYINYMLSTEGQVIVDYDSVGGDTVHSKVYEKYLSSRQILDDIRNYFNGAKQSDLMSFHTKYSDRTFSYDELVAKGEIIGRTIRNGTEVPLKDDGSIDAGKIVTKVRQNCQKIETKSATPTYFIHVPDIGRNVQVTDKGITHGFFDSTKKHKTPSKRDMVNAKVSLALSEILSDSIEVNHSYRDGNNDISYAHIMIGVVGMEDDIGVTEYYAVRSVIEERTNLDPILVEAEILGKLHAVNAKKIDSPNLKTAENSATRGNDDVYFDYSIAHLLEDVKGIFDDTFSDDVYNKLSAERMDTDFSKNLLYQDRATDSFSNRSLLAGALETAVQNDIEREKLKQYKQKIDLINAEEQKLQDLREQIKGLSFKKGPKDTKAIKDLQFEAEQAANRINTYDRQLLSLESTKALKGVLEREKEQARKKAEQKSKEALAKQKEKSAQTQRELMNRYQESRKRGIESRNKTAMRHKIKDVVNDLNDYLLKGTKEKHVPIGLQSAVAEALNAVNMDTVGAEERIAKKRAEMMKAKTPEAVEKLAKEISNIQEMGGNMNAKLARLKTAYDDILGSDDPIVANSHDEVISNTIDKVIEYVGDTSLRDMNLHQLEAVYDMYKMILSTVRNANKAFKAKKSEEISVIAGRVMEEIDLQGKKKGLQSNVGDAVSTLDWNNQKPVYAFERIGSDTFTEVFNSVRDGEDVWARDMTEAQAFLEDQKTKYKYNSWDFDKRYKFASSTGNDFSLSLGQIMSLYAYSKRGDQAKDHLKYGGFVFDGLTKVKEKGKFGVTKTYTLKDSTAYNLSDGILEGIISKLTDEQKGFADAMQDYLSTAMGEKGNEVSLALYDVKLFKEKNYFPLKSAPQFLERAREQAQGETKIKNKGFTKETKPKAKNPIVLTSFMDVWAGHVNEMSMYHAFALALEDFYRIYNYKTPASETMSSESVISYLENAHGGASVAYIDQLLKDLNGGARSDQTTGFINKMMGLFKKSAVFASASVVIQQPSAIARATALVDAKYFVGKPSKHKDTWAEVKKYAPVAIIKEMGYFDTGMGKSSVEWLKGDKTLQDKFDDLVSKAPALADEYAWCAIWNAVKRETARKNQTLSTSSDEFLNLVGERFTEVIVKTQVYDSVLSRSGNMRSKDTGMKMATAFMAESTTSLNMLQNALVQGKRGNKKAAAKIVGGVLSSMILNSILVSIVYAGRDDDDEKTYAEKYVGTLVKELLDSFNPLTLVPFVKDIVSIAQGYDIERSDMAVITDLINAWNNLDSDNRSVYRKVEDFGGAIASIFGLPIKNVMRDVRGMYNTINSFINGEKTTGAGMTNAVTEALTGKEKSNSQQLYDAMVKGDTEQIERVSARFEDQAAINSAIRKMLRENDPRIKEAAQARYNGDIDEYMKIAKKIIAEGNFKQDDIVAAINSEINAMKRDAES